MFPRTRHLSASFTSRIPVALKDLASFRSAITPRPLSLSVRNGSSASAKPDVSRMPLFMAYCPDYPTAVPSTGASVSAGGGGGGGGDGGDGEKGESDTYAKRLSVRQEHWARAQEDKQAGRLFFGLGYLPPADSPIFSHPARIPPGASTSGAASTSAAASASAAGAGAAATPPAMAGSLMLMHYPSLQDMWERIRSDVYWTSGVWDKDKTVVHEFISAPAPAPDSESTVNAGVAGGGAGGAAEAGAGGANEPEKGAEDSQ